MHPIKIASSFVGTPYCLGGTDRENGMDCFSYILIYMEHNGVKIPEEWNGFERDKCGEQYSNLFKKDPDKAKEIMIEFLTAFIEEIHISNAIPGDIVLLSLKGSTGRYFTGVMAGNNCFYSVIESQGIISTQLNGYKIKRAFRCHKQ